MQNRRMKNTSIRRSRRTERLTGAVFVICLALLVLVNLLVPDKKVSENENLALSDRPKLTWNSLVSGDFMIKYEDYLSDQFAGRELWRSLKVSLSRLGGSKKENGVLIGKDQQLLTDIVIPDQDILSENLAAMKQFAEDNSEIPVNVMLVPDAATVLSEQLPNLATVADQNRMIAQVKRELGDSVVWMDASEVLNKHSGEKIYYKTDPLWTSLGAFYVFGETAEQMNITVDYTSAYASYPVTTTFNGGLAAKSGRELNVKEQIDIYVPKDVDNDVTVSYVDEQRKTTSLYDSTKLETRDQCDVFLGGNSSLIDIKTVSESGRRLLIIRDSFADCYVPFLTPYFREIVMVDPRYYSGTIENIMDDYRISDVLFLYSGNAFFQDNNISGVLSGE